MTLVEGRHPGTPMTNNDFHDERVQGSGKRGVWDNCPSVPSESGKWKTISFDLVSGTLLTTSSSFEVKSL